jgi:hypothetical protein
MKIAETLLAQLEREIPPTRKLLERVPEGDLDWKPHPKSMPIGYHLDLAAGEQPAPPSTAAERLAIFDGAVSETRRALSNTTDDHLMKPWQLRMGDKVLDEKPRHIMIVDTFSHLAHHRGQLGVYLRLNDKPLPSIYGPTADEGWQQS